MQISLTGFQAAKSTHAAVQCILWFSGHREVWVGCHSLPSQKVTPALPDTYVPIYAEPSQPSWWPALCSLLTSGVHSLLREHHCPRNTHAPMLSCSSLLFHLFISVSGACSVSSYWSSSHHTDVCNASWATQPCLCPHCHHQTHRDEQGNFRHSTAAGCYLPYGSFFFLLQNLSKSRLLQEVFKWFLTTPLVSKWT